MQGKSPEAFKRFFEQTTVDAFFEKRSTIVGKKRIFRIDKNIVEVIAKEMLMPQQADYTGGDDDEDGVGHRDGVPAGDLGMSVFEPVYVNDRYSAHSDDDVGAEMGVSCYQVTVSNPLQYDYVVSFLGARLSFRKISKVVLENRDNLGCAVKTGYVSDGDASCFSRILSAVHLQVLAELMATSWAFAVGSDVSTDDFRNSQLDVRVRFMV
eukprot:IDg18275t1